MYKRQELIGQGQQISGDIALNGGKLTAVQDTEITDNSVYFQGVIKQHMDWTCTETNDAQTKGGGRVMISVLQDPPTVNSNSDIGTNNTGQRNMILNGTTPGLGAWPFIQAINFTATNDVEYGSESLEVSWGTSEY